MALGVGRGEVVAAEAGVASADGVTVVARDVLAGVDPGDGDGASVNWAVPIGVPPHAASSSARAAAQRVNAVPLALWPRSRLIGAVYDHGFERGFVV